MIEKGGCKMKKGSSFVKKYLWEHNTLKTNIKINEECCGACACNERNSEDVEILKSIFSLITELFFQDTPVEIVIQHGILKE
jgi:hypothetical protein